MKNFGHYYFKFTFEHLSKVMLTEKTLLCLRLNDCFIRVRLKRLYQMQT